MSVLVVPRGRCTITGGKSGIQKPLGRAVKLAWLGKRNSIKSITDPREHAIFTISWPLEYLTGTGTDVLGAMDWTAALLASSCAVYLNLLLMTRWESFTKSSVAVTWTLFQQPTQPMVIQHSLVVQGPKVLQALNRHSTMSTDLWPCIEFKFLPCVVHVKAKGVS